MPRLRQSVRGRLPDANGTPFCDDAACCEAVCAVDAFCCDIAWDGICADEANDICYFGCDGLSGNCYESNGSPGCNVFDCCVAVCEIDGFCCDNTWDSICAGEAADICGNCGDPNAGGCFVSNGTPGCDDSACCEPTCADDPFCCNVSWDSLCADEAAGLCGFAQCPGQGDCFSSNGSPGCNDGSCCELVCAVDAFCCNNTWDGICANEANDICN